MLSSPLCPRYFRLLHHTITGAALARNRCTAFTQTQKYKIHKYIHTIYRRPEFARGRCTSFTLLLTSHCTSHTFPPFQQFPTSMTASSFEAGVRKISSPTYSKDKHKTNCTKIPFLLNAAQYCIVWRRNEIKQSVFLVTLAQMYNVVQRHCCTNAHLAQCNLVS